MKLLTTSLSRFQPETFHQKVRKLPSPVVGFRCWTIDYIDQVHRHKGPPSARSAVALFPLNVQYGPWNPGVNVAKCMVHASDHHPAAPNCGCGFWIKDSYKGAQAFMGSTGLIGVAMGWGRVQNHTDGWRCEFATPLVLAYEPKSEAWGPDLVKLYHSIATRFDLSLITTDEVEPWYLENTQK